jgi:hypothetical protein
MPAPFETRYIRQRFVTTGWSGEEMAQAGSGLVKRGILPRLALGLTTSDAPAPPLAPKYLKRKVRRGRKGIRDWNLTGRTTRSLKVLTAQTNQAVIGFTDAETNRRAFINNFKIRQFGVSPSDRVVVQEELGRLPSPIKLLPSTKGGL